MNLQQHKNFDEPHRDKRKPSKKREATKDAVQPELSRKDYEKQLEKLQVELCYLQDWVRETGARVVIVCEGRDTAGKGGLIKRMTERVSPRTFRVVALSAPSQHERQKLFLQRYVEQLPAAGEVVIFDRSWYNRAGVERVMKYTPKEDVEKFLENVPKFERWLVEAGVILIKLARGRDGGTGSAVPAKDRRPTPPMETQPDGHQVLYTLGRLHPRPRRYVRRDEPPGAPWYALRSDDKKRARLNGIKHILSMIPYKRIKREKIQLPKRSDKPRRKDKLDLHKVKLVPEVF